MRLISTILIFISVTHVFAGPSVDQEKSKLKEIGSKFKGSSDKQKASRCEALGQYLLENKGQSDIVTLKDEPVFSVKSMDLSSMDKLDDETLQLYNDFFSSCRFEIHKAFIGFCPECKGLQRVTIPLFIIQKVSDGVYFANLTETTRGQNISNRYAVIQTDKPKTKSGQYSTVFLQAGSEKFSMLNGFTKRQDVVLEIGYSRASAIFCRFNQFIKTMQTKYKDMFRCGYYLNDEDFYESSSVGLVCAQASEFTKSGKDKKKDLWIMDFDHKECK